MPDYTLRLATVADTLQITEHHYRMFTDMGLYTSEQLDAVNEVFVGWLRERLEQNTYIGWLAVNATGNVIGGAGLVLMDYIPNPSLPLGNGAHIVDVYVYPAYRRQGIARHLMNAVLQWCKANGYHRVTLSASDAGRPLYESMGFTSTSQMAISLYED